MAGFPEKEEEIMTTSRQREMKLYYCSLCGKDFVSGRALGGHMSSAHPRSKTLKRSRPEKEINGEISREDYHAYTCLQCGRIFLTAKALHGHMRSHPERAWRGMYPPSPAKYAAVDSSQAGEGLHGEGDSGIDAGSCSNLLVWGSTARRGRKALKPRHTAAVIELAEVNTHAVAKVIKLETAATCAGTSTSTTTAAATVNGDDESDGAVQPKKFKFEWDLNVEYLGS